MDIFSQNKDILLVILSMVIAPYVTLHTNVWNQSYADRKYKNQWLIILKKCSYVNKGFKQISTYDRNTFDRYSKTWNGILLATIIEAIVRLISIPYISYRVYLIATYIIEILIILLYFKMYDSDISSKKLLYPQFTEEMRIKKRSKNVLFRYYLLAGIIIGIDICFLLTVYNLILAGTLSLNILSFFYFSIVILISIVFIRRLKEITDYFHFKSKTTIMDSNKHHFPFVIIKTQHNVIKGQLIDILNKDTITLNGDSGVKTVLWSKIELMEIKTQFSFFN